MRRALSLLALACAGICALYWPTLNYGFDYDDYHFVHPYSRADVAAAFTGTWDPAGIERAYYRPLTIALFAVRFELLGVDSVSHHALSLGLFAASAFLTGWFVYRLTGRALGGLFSIVFFGVHPAMPYSLAVWITNQMHLLELLFVLLSFCWWHAVRRRSVRWWAPLLLFAAAAFLVKEDGIMLLPAILTLQVVQRRLAEPDLPPVGRPFVALSAATILGLLLIRHGALREMPSHGLPEWSTALDNYWSGLYRTFCIAPADRPWQRIASWFAASVPATGVLLWRRATPRSRAALVSGAAVALVFNLPFVFITKPEQLHLVALGAVIVLTAGLLSIRDVIMAPMIGGLAGAVVAAGVAVFAVVTMDVTRDFEPFGPIVLSHDRLVERWAAVPPEVRDYLAKKRMPGATDRISPNLAAAVERITFGAHDREIGRDGVAFQWMSGRRSDILISPDAQTVVIPLRHAIEIFSEPVHVSIEADGRVVDQMELSTSEWRMSETAVGRMRTSWSGGMHRIVVRTDRVWRPSQVIRGSGDDRVLGLQLGVVTVRPQSPVSRADSPR